MAITLINGAASVVLPPDLEWTDELSWCPVVQRVRWSLTGALLLESAARQAGRWVTLEGDESRAWMLRSDLLTVKGWAAMPGLQLDLDYHGSLFDVVFRHGEGDGAGAIEARPVFPFANPDAADRYSSLRLRFIVL